MERHTRNLTIGILFLAPFLAIGAGLSDLEKFSRTMQAMEKTYADPEQRVQYKKALENYSAKQSPVTRDFENTFKQLHELWVRIDGVGQRLVKTQPPLRLQYAKEGNYSFDRVAQPLQAVWLLQNLKERKTDPCSERDTLLVSQWTPLLKDTSVFAVEKNGAYTGTTLTLVPMKGAKGTYLVVIPSGKEELLTKPLLEAFLKDIRKKNITPHPFALIQKVQGQKNHYQISAVNDEGRTVGSLGPLKGFAIDDPMAKKLVAVAPVQCSPYTTDLAANTKPAGGDSAGGKGGPSETNFVFNANPVANAQANLNNGNESAQAAQKAGVGGSKGVQNLPRGNDSTGIQNAPRDVAVDRAPANVNNVVNNNLSNTKEAGGRDIGAKYQPNGGGYAGAGAGGSAGSNGKGFSYLPPGFGAGTGNNLSAGGSAGNGSQTANNSPPSVDRDKLSPDERRALDALERAERAMRNGGRVPRRDLEEINRGAGSVQDLDLKKRQELVVASAYVTSTKPSEAVKLFAEYTGDRKALEKQVVENFCEDCKDCAYCIEIQNRKSRTQQ